ncbi:hypothetical protein ABDK00_014160 [Niabella insulamsoli]|uniref:hypothetical protein n=1 Tax=Niabella insulamsoli TaxID=3144874 RepID=UPI0031FBBA9E
MGHNYLYEDAPPELVLSRKTGGLGFYRRPSIFMPKEAARIFLKVTKVRVERLHDISVGDAVAEGVETLGLYPGYDISPKGKFEGLWNNINKNWDANPFVWVYDFERVEKPHNFH